MGSGTFGNVASSWSIACTGDFNGDGFSDILWRGAGGEVAPTLSKGQPLKASPYLGGPGPRTAIRLIWEKVRGTRASFPGPLQGNGSLVARYEWAVQRGRYMALENIAPLSNTPLVGLPAVAT